MGRALSPVSREQRLRPVGTDCRPLGRTRDGPEGHAGEQALHPETHVDGLVTPSLLLTGSRGGGGGRGGCFPEKLTGRPVEGVGQEAHSPGLRRPRWRSDDRRSRHRPPAVPPRFPGPRETQRLPGSSGGNAAGRTRCPPATPRRLPGQNGDPIQEWGSRSQCRQSLRGPLECGWGLGCEGRKNGRVVRTRVCWDV